MAYRIDSGELMSKKITNSTTCQKKVPYLYKRYGLKALNLLRKQKKYWDKDLRVYKCNVCGKYHIGHSTSSLDKIFDSILEKKNG